MPLAQLSYREVDQFVEQQQQQGHAWATINRRLYALKHFCDFCLTQRLMGGNPVKPSHFVRRGHPLPKALSREQLQRLFAQIAHPMDRALFLVMLRCGLRVSEVAQLKLDHINWEQQALDIEQGKGRKDRRVYMSPDAVASVQQGPTEGKLRCNPVGCWREISIAVFPFRAGTFARKWSCRGPFCFRSIVRISGSGNLRKFVRDE